MEAAAGRGGSLPAPPSSSQPLRKEWRAVSEHSSFRNGEDPEHVKLSQSDERMLYEEGRAPLDVDFCSITMDGIGGLSDEILQQRLHEITRQREELQHVEIELRAQAIMRVEILQAQNHFQSKIKEHADAAGNLKEQLREREQHIHELEIKLEEKDMELRAVKLDNEAAWAKDDLLREQNKELVTFRRERDNSEAERAQHLKQIHDLQEHVQEKENQILALEEQHRVAQETIIFKDEQLRETQTWIARVQEMDALQSTTMQAELRERTEQFNRYWIGIQQQFAEVERHHLQAIQQLQLELAEARGIYKEDAKIARQNSPDSTSYAQTDGSQINAKDAYTSNGNLGFMANGNLEGHPCASSSTVSSKTEHASGVAVVPSPVLGMAASIPQTQMSALHPFLMQSQGVPQSVLTSSPQIPPSHIGQFQPVTTTILQHWQHQQTVPDVSQSPNQNDDQPFQTEQSVLRSDAHYNYDLPAERKVIHPDHLNTHIEQQQRSSPVINGSSNREEVVLESNSKQYQASQEPQQTSVANAPFHPTLLFVSPEKKSEVTVQDQIAVCAINRSQEQLLGSGQQWLASIANISVVPSHSMNSNNVAECSEKVVVFPESASTVRTSNMRLPAQTSEPTLLDERSLLACIVRAVPAGADGRTRISTTLPNRLAKMLTPLHWHDYKKYFGKLEDFVAHHPELFIIEGDFIHLREGAQEIISATTAFAKVAAASASLAPYSSLFPSVALTPVAQSSRHKPVPPVDSRPPDILSFMEGGSKIGDSSDKRSQISKRNQQPNGVSFNISKGLSDMNMSVKSKNLQEVNGSSTEIRPAHSSAQNAVGNEVNKGLANGRLSSGGKQQARSAGAGIISRR